jgi:putative colanic acid biosynthesis UDP-glucose lipid carrier transferase
MPSTNTPFIMAARYSKYLPGSIFIVNLLILNLATLITALVFFRFTFQDNFWLTLNLSWLVASAIAGIQNLSRPLNFANHSRKLLLSIVLFEAVVFGFSNFFKADRWQRDFWIWNGLIFSALLFAAHYILFQFLKFLRKKGFNLRHIIVVGEDDIYKRIANSFREHPEYGYHILGFIPEKNFVGLTKTGIRRLLAVNEPEEIFICYKAANKRLVNCLIEIGKTDNIKINIITDQLLKDRYIKLINCNHPSLLHLVEYPCIGRKSQMLKRAFDIAFSLIVMIIGLPLFIVLYVITRMSSKGPAFYKQERIGKDGRPFFMYKFRSMYVDAEQNGPQLSYKNDPRITNWGRIIRRTRLDELPQFWNVFKGDMAVVGYRPERRHYIEKIVERTPNYKRLINMKPGITSMGQVEYGYAENVDQMCVRLRYDLLYLRCMNLNTDLRIILQTVKVMAQGRGK